MSVLGDPVLGSTTDGNYVTYPYTYPNTYPFPGVGPSTDQTSFTYSYSYPKMLTDAEIDAIADKIIEKLAARNHRIVEVMHPDDV